MFTFDEHVGQLQRIVEHDDVCPGARLQATALALAALLALGGDVIRGFVFAMLWGVFVGCYSTIYVAKNLVLWLGVKRDWSRKVPEAPGDMPAREGAGTPFSDSR